MEPFTPTHEITHNGRAILVQESDGAFYTREEWDNAESADWALDADAGLLFQGAVPMGESSFRRLPSRAQIIALRSEAKQRGDYRTADLCGQALAGDEDSVRECSAELRAGLAAYNRRISDLGGYGVRVAATMPNGVERVGVLIELGSGGAQPGLVTDDGRRYAIGSLDAVRLAGE